MDRCGATLFRINEVASRCGRLPRFLAYNVVPFEPILSYGDLDRERLIDLCKLVTFDALTPTFDRPLTRREFCGTIEAEGFRIDHLYDPPLSPLYCTATRRG